MGIGVDICYIPRYEDKDNLAKRILSNEEYKIYEKRTKKAEFLAGKANNGKIKDLNFKEISVVYDINNCPILLFRDKQYDVSISHDGEYAIAVVLINE